MMYPFPGCISAGGRRVGGPSPAVQPLIGELRQTSGSGMRTGPARQRRRRAARQPRRTAQAPRNGGVQSTPARQRRRRAGRPRVWRRRHETAAFRASRPGKGAGGRGGPRVWRRRCKTAGFGGAAAHVRGPPPALPPHGTHFPDGS